MIPALILAVALTHGSPVVSAPADLPFGLDKLHWGMPEREARPACRPIAGCLFTVTLDFEQAGLTQIELESEGTRGLQACSGRIKALLLRQYGGEDGGFSSERNPHGLSEYASWSGARTDVTYGALKNGFIDITFRRRDGGR